LRNFDVLVVLLKIDEKFIEQNVRTSLKIRKTWAKGKSGTMTEKVIYYKGQQRKLLKIAAESKLPVIKINTTRKDWGGYLARTLKKI